MILGQRIALDPNKAETRYFWRAAGVNRKAWNWGKSEWDEDFAAAKALETIDPFRAKAMRPSAHALKAKWARIRKTEFPWSFEVTKCAGTQAILDLGVAYARAAKERADAKREGRKPRKMFGFPKYKSRTKSIPSFALWNDQFQIRNVYGFGRDRSEIRIPNLGWVRLREPVKSIGGIMGARISYHRGRWFVAIQHDLDWNDGEKSAKALNQAKSKERKRLGLEATDPLDFDEGAYQRSNRFLPTHPMSGCVGGVDAGLSSLVTTTVISAAGITTTKTPRVRHDARTERQTRIENRRKRKLNKSITRARIKLAAKKLGIAEKDVKPKDYRTIKCRLSKNQSKLSRQITKVQGRSSDCRRDTSHKVSTEIARSAEIIVIEELAVANMMKNHNLAGSFADAGLGELLRQIDYKVRVLGGICLKAPRLFPSSKMCSVCQAINTDLGLNDREWSCGECGTRHDRDENAAKNLAWLGKIAASDVEVPASVTQWSRWFVEAKREIAEWRSLKQLAPKGADLGEAIAEVKPMEIVDRGLENQPSETVVELGTKQLETARDHLCSRFG